MNGLDGDVCLLKPVMPSTEIFVPFFEGLDAGLKSLREVRAVYDEQVAFEFNSTRFFGPNENKTSEILAFFLSPNECHGQKATFLNLFVNQFKIQVPPILFEDLKTIKVTCEDPTPERRRIDITIVFGDSDYVIGIENKFGRAADGRNQLKDYAEDLRRRTSSDKKWTLFYLTPNRENPSGDSIDETRRDELVKSENLRMISYHRDIIELLGRFELACKAESVRAFLKDFRQYLKQRYLGETVMGETEFVKATIEKIRLSLHI